MGFELSRQKDKNPPLNELTGDLRPGLLRGNGFESTCVVGILTLIVPDSAPVVLERYVHWSERSLPPRDYELHLDGKSYIARRSGKFWQVSAG